MPSTPDPSVRLRPSISCAECRRLKMKCDEIKPCSNCSRRGCASICPQGQLVSKGNKFVLANTEQLVDGPLSYFLSLPADYLYSHEHDQIDALLARVHQLEAALEISHSLHSTEPHALLRETFDRVEKPGDSTITVPEPGSDEQKLVDSMGTLTLDGHGSRYFGSTGAFAYLWRDGNGPDGPEVRYKGEVSRVLSEFPPEIAHMAHSFPIRLPTGDTTHLSTWILDNYLPPFAEAWTLFENYWEHYAMWHFTPFTRAGFIEQIFSPLYHRSKGHADKPLGHRLGLLFMVFAIGEFMDLTKPLGPSTGQRYCLLSRASLCLDPVFESPTVTALQAMYLMSAYLMIFRGVNEPEHAWILLGLNIKLAFTLGLQHDATKFDISKEEIEARQHLQVSIFCQEIWVALSVGRPPSFSFENFDWVYPKEPENSTLDSISPRHWSANFTRDCGSKVLETVVGSKGTSYSAILKLGAIIRDYPPFSHASETSEDISEPQSIGRAMQYAFTDLLRELCVLHLHRRFFAMALRESPEDPLNSPFASSVLECHRSAVRLISRASTTHYTMPAITQRLWFMWPNAFVATLILGSIVARSPACSLAPAALADFEMACQLWETSSDSVCGPKILATVRKLKDKAITAFSRHRAPKYPLDFSVSGLEVTDELHALGGGGPGVKSPTPKRSVSPPSMPHFPKQASPFIESSSSTSVTSHVPRSYIAPGTHTSAEPVRDPGIPPLTGVLPDMPPSSIGSPFDFTGVDFSSHFLELAVNMLPEDSWTATTAPSQGIPAAAGSSVLEELGIRGWQPVMDELGL